MSTNSEIARREAYRSSLGDLANWKHRIYSELLSRSTEGATCDELEVALGCQFTTAGAVIITLRDTGWVIDSGQFRDTRRNHRAVVWVALENPLENPPFTRRGKGKWKAACREIYDLLLDGMVDEAIEVVEKVLMKS